MAKVDDMTDILSPESGEDQAGVDGRTMRRTRNRSAVIDALLAMIREGNLRPGASDIADRAGVSHRSIFRYFNDLDDLVRTTINQAFSEASNLTHIADLGEGPLPDRIARIVDSRLALFVSVDRPMQLARTRASSIPTIDDEIAAIARIFKEQIRTHFATELSELDDAHSEAVVDALLVLTSYDSFYIHARLLGYDTENIASTWKLQLAALLSR